MLDSQRFPFTQRRDAFGVVDAIPQLPLILTYRNATVEVSGLLDTGASVNVLPYSPVLSLWENPIAQRLSGL